MSFFRHAASADKRADKPTWMAALALAGAYALARVLDPGEGTKRARSPVAGGVAGRPGLGWRGWKHVLYRTYEEISEDRLLALAAGVVFYGLLALFPAVTALVSSYALFASPSTIGAHLASLAGMMPASAYGIVNEQIGRIVNGDTGGLSAAFFFGLALALWSANAGMKAIIDALNIAYGVKERRSFLKLNLISLALTVGAIGGLLLAIAAVVALPVVMSYLPFVQADWIAWLRWPALLALLLFGLAVLYRFGPDFRHPRWHWISPGATFAALAWIAGSALLSWYLASFADYDATYGSLGAGIGLMMWLWMSAIVVLFGAELNSEIDNASPPRRVEAEEKIGGA